VLNRDSKQFGKQHMFDDSRETCWNSHQVLDYSTASSQHFGRVNRHNGLS